VDLPEAVIASVAAMPAQWNGTAGACPVRCSIDLISSCLCPRCLGANSNEKDLAASRASRFDIACVPPEPANSNGKAS